MNPSLTHQESSPSAWRIGFSLLNLPFLLIVSAIRIGFRHAEASLYWLANSYFQDSDIDGNLPDFHVPNG